MDWIRRVQNCYWDFSFTHIVFTHFFLAFKLLSIFVSDLALLPTTLNSLFKSKICNKYKKDWYIFVHGKVQEPSRPCPGAPRGLQSQPQPAPTAETKLPLGPRSGHTISTCQSWLKCKSLLWNTLYNKWNFSHEFYQYSILS